MGGIVRLDDCSTRRRGPWRAICTGGRDQAADQSTSALYLLQRGVGASERKRPSASASPHRPGMSALSISALRRTSPGFWPLDDADDRGMAEREAQRGLGELDAVGLAERLGFGARAREPPAAPAGNGSGRRVSARGRIPELYGPPMTTPISSRRNTAGTMHRPCSSKVAPGEQEHVEIAGPRERLGDLLPSMAAAMALNRPGARISASPGSRRSRARGGARRRLTAAVREHVDVVRVDDVDVIEAEPLQRELERAHHAVVA